MIHDPMPAPLVRVRELSHRYGDILGLQRAALDAHPGRIVGLIGPDGVGKSTLLSIISGARRVQTGQVEVLGGDMADAAHRRRVCARVAYMPQGLGKNLYATLSVRENVDFFGRLFGHGRAERARRIEDLLAATRLARFADRPAGKLSGGMKQKLGLCCALIHDPDVLILDEPTTGVDPLSRRQFWELVDTIRGERPGMAVLVATAYMEEAARFDDLAAMDGGQVLARGTPAELLARTGAKTLEDAFVGLLPAARREGHEPLVVPPRTSALEGPAAIEAKGLTQRFGDFVAVDHVSFRIPRGEIFGFLGSNGCGKTTTMKMLTGLLPASEGEAWLFGQPIDASDVSTRRRVGYMSQAFSLYGELTVRQNLVLHGRLFGLPEEKIPARVDEMARRFELELVLDVLPASLPLGTRQRLSLAVAMIHGPEMLILDEPTSGVDPLARDEFWRSLLELSRRDGVTIFISTHFMNEAERCDRISLMHAGRVLVSDTPAAITAARGAASLEEAFVSYLKEAAGTQPDEPAPAPPAGASATPQASTPAVTRAFDPRRMLSYSRREAVELRRDPVRLTLALLGSILLLIVCGYGLSLDVEDLKFAVLDRDQSVLSREYALNISGSRYFIERAPLLSEQEANQRMVSGELALVVELAPGFGRDLERGAWAEVGAWIDGSNPTRAEIIKSHVRGMHAQWLSAAAKSLGRDDPRQVNIETRFRYNPNVMSIVAMVPAMIPVILLLIPAMLTAVGVVREKELGSIVNLYVTPVTRAEFLLGKQLPYVALALLNLLLMIVEGVFFMGVPMAGNVAELALATVPYAFFATGFGLLVSSVTRSQIAAVFGTAALTILPAARFSGMIDPVSSLEGVGAVIGRIYPTAYYMTISRGIFAKGLHLAELLPVLVPILIAGPLLLVVSALLLPKQED